MPYIPKLDQERLSWELDGANTPGELNFCITMLCGHYIGQNKNYSKFNEVIGVLESAKLELYRRMVAPYEDKKKEENGDVY